jgi:hypothetical protein
MQLPSAGVPPMVYVMMPQGGAQHSMGGGQQWSGLTGAPPTGMFPAQAVAYYQNPPVGTAPGQGMPGGPSYVLVSGGLAGAPSTTQHIGGSRLAAGFQSAGAGALGGITRGQGPGGTQTVPRRDANAGGKQSTKSSAAASTLDANAKGLCRYGRDCQRRDC